MEILDILMIALVIGIVVCVIHYQVMKRKHKSSGGCCGCSHCQFHEQCKEKEEENSSE